MIRVVFLLVLAGSTGSIALPKAAAAEAAPPADGAFVLTIERSGGFVDPDQDPLALYRFTVAKDGGWELKPARGEARKGKLRADALTRWLKEIEEGGFDKLKSNPSLGAADEPFMEITIRAKGKKEQKRIRLEEKLVQAVEKKVIELAKQGKELSGRGRCSFPRCRRARRSRRYSSRLPR